MATQQQGETQGKDFGFSRLKPENPDQLLEEDEYAFDVYLVQVKSDSDIGREELNNPLEVLRREAGIDIGDSDVRAQVLRVNAEVPANPVRRSTVWMIYPGSTTAVGIQYKYPHSDT
jgi:hypothetical protein